jgi:glycosyltransferase involved in cell wall biosynthesis
MKIALVVHDFDPRVGHGRYSDELARRLAVRHEVHVWANRFEAPLLPNLHFRYVPACRRTALASVITFLVASEALLRRERFDLIHAQGLTCWQADVITAHLCNAARRELDPPRRWRHWVFPLVVCPLERRFYRQRQASHLIAISGRVAGEIKRYYGWQRATTVIYHGTDLEQFCPPSAPEHRRALWDQFGLPHHAWKWLFVGEAVKGLGATIAELPAFPSAHLLVVSRSDLTPYRRLGESLGVAQRVAYHGPTDSVLQAYQAADVLVYPCHYDAFGLVVAEAMACSLPVIVGQNTGAAEWIEAQRNGLVCNPNQSGSLRAQLLWLQAAPSRSLALGQAARATVSRHSWDTCAAETLAAYESVRRSGRQPALPGRDPDALPG